MSFAQQLETLHYLQGYWAKQRQKKAIEQFKEEYARNFMANTMDQMPDVFDRAARLNIDIPKLQKEIASQFAGLGQQS